MYNASEAREASNTQKIIINAARKISNEIDDATKFGKYEACIVFTKANNYEAISNVVANLYQFGYNVKVLVDSVVEVRFSWKYPPKK